MVSPRVWAGVDRNGWYESRSVWMTGKLGMVKCAYAHVCVYSSVNEKGIKCKMKTGKFWEKLGQCLKKFEHISRVFVLGNMN